MVFKNIAAKRAGGGSGVQSVGAGGAAQPKATVGTLIPPVGAYQHDRNNIVRAANTLLGSKSTKERKKWESELMARAGKNPSAAVWNLRRRAELMHKVDDGSWIRYQQLADKIENKLMVVKNR